jgi:hypothetical protein
MHADSIDNVVKRLTSPPMNVSRVYIPLMNSALHVQRVELPHEREGLTFGRRVRTVWEIEDYDQYREVAVWNPRDDTFETWFEDSFLLERIAQSKGISKQDLLKEIEARTSYLQEIVKTGVRDQRKVAEKVLSYYTQKREGKEVKKETKTKRPSKRKPLRSKRLGKLETQEKAPVIELEPKMENGKDVEMEEGAIQKAVAMEEDSPPEGERLGKPSVRAVDNSLGSRRRISMFNRKKSEALKGERVVST